MTSDDKIREKKLQYDTNSIIIWKNDKYEYLPGEKILSSNRGKIIESAKFTYSPLGKAFEK